MIAGGGGSAETLAPLPLGPPPGDPRGVEAGGGMGGGGVGGGRGRWEGGDRMREGCWVAGGWWWG